jgi:ribosomal protein S8
MKIDGKVLFFSQSDGKGIIITPQKEKIEFSVQEWDDFDVMPSTGLVVSFDFEDEIARNISAKSSESSQENSTNEKSVSMKEVLPDDVVVFSDDEDYAENTIDNRSVQKLDENLKYMNNGPENGTVSQSSGPLAEVGDVELPSDVVLFADKVTVTENFDADEPVTEIIEEELPSDVVVFPDDEPVEEHFENQDDIALLENLEEEIPPREESITVTLNLPIAVANYFNIIENHINRRVSYKKVTGRLDYLVIRRFLWTTYNNLSEIDLHIITPKIKMLGDDLKIMSRVYDDFSTKIRHPRLAFEEVFLSCQAEYKKIRDGAQKVIEKLNLLRSNEKVIGGVLRVKKEELDKNIKSVEFGAMKEELKSLNGAYVDVVHMMAELDERYKHDLQLLNDFEQEYRDDFYEIFAVEAKKHKKDILEILNAQAYIVDAQLWQQAKVSKSIKAHFKKSSIDGELNTKTYLKYYLDTIDSTKAVGDSQALFDLYDYLVTLQKDYILVMVSSAQDAMEYESCIKNADKSYNVKSFIDEKAAIQWAMRNSVKVLVVEDRLQSTNVETFLNVYHNNIFVKPKIILIGSKPKLSSSAYSITKLLMKNASSKVVVDSIKSLLTDKSS